MTVAAEFLTSTFLSGIMASTSVLTVGGAAWLFGKYRALEARAKRDQSRHAAVLENLTEGYYRANMSGELLFANPALAKLNGCANVDEYRATVWDKKYNGYADPARRAQFHHEIETNGSVSDFVSEVIRPKLGDRIWVSENARVVYDKVSGKPLCYEGTIRDTTDIVLRMQEKDRLIKLASHVPGGLFQLEWQGTGHFEVVFTSTGFRELLDWQSKEQRFDLQRFMTIIHPDDLATYYAALRTSRKTMKQWVQEFRVVTDGGKAKWLKVQGTPELQSDGRVVWYGYLQDVTASKADEAQFRSLAYNDTLTQLPNRRLLLERLQQTIASCARRNECAAVLFIDLDNFKLLNDTHGHKTGDLLLIEIAKRLKKLVRRNDTVARLAGDEFVVLLEGLGRDKAAANIKTAMVAEKFLSAFKKSFDLGALTTNISASIGAISFDGSAKSVDDILRHADTAMYEVKKAGRNAYRIFEQGRDMESGNQLKIGEDLKQVVKKKQLVLRLQPQLDRDGVITGAEALIRWNHPTFGMLTPDKFMGLAEQRGQSREIGQFVLEHAAKLLARWQANPPTETLRLAVNISSQQFLNEEFVDEIRALIHKHKFNSSRLTLELTEQVISKDRENAVKAMEMLKTTGIRLSLDDFGTGFSSLSHLNDMPLDEVKIDGKFVRVMQDRPKDTALVKTILAMAETLGLATVAEHVETREQEKFLLAHGCDVFQGYLYSSAMTLDDFEDSVARNARGQQRVALANVA